MKYIFMVVNDQCSVLEKKIAQKQATVLNDKWSLKTGDLQIAAMA